MDSHPSLNVFTFDLCLLFEIICVCLCPAGASIALKMPLNYLHFVFVAYRSYRQHRSALYEKSYDWVYTTTTYFAFALHNWHDCKQQYIEKYVIARPLNRIRESFGVNMNYYRALHPRPAVLAVNLIPFLASMVYVLRKIVWKRLTEVGFDPETSSILVWYYTTRPKRKW